MTMETSQKCIRVPCPEINSRHITESRFLALDPHTLRVCIREVGIVCRLVPEAIVLQHLGELTQIRLADFDAIAPPEFFGNLGVSAPTVKQLEKGPLVGYKAKQFRSAGNMSYDDRLTVLDMLP